MAKAKPRPKTIWTTLAKLAGVTENTLKTILKGVAILVVVYALVLAWTQGASTNY